MEGLEIRGRELGDVARLRAGRDPANRFRIVSVVPVLRLGAQGAGRLFAAADRLHETDALLLQDALHALDRVAFAVEEMADAP